MVEQKLEVFSSPPRAISIPLVVGCNIFMFVSSCKKISQVVEQVNTPHFSIDTTPFFLINLNPQITLSCFLFFFQFTNFPEIDSKTQTNFWR